MLGVWNWIGIVVICILKEATLLMSGERTQQSDVMAGGGESYHGYIMKQQWGISTFDHPLHHQFDLI